MFPHQQDIYSDRKQTQNAYMFVHPHLQYSQQQFKVPKTNSQQNTIANSSHWKISHYHDQKRRENRQQIKKIVRFSYQMKHLAASNTSYSNQESDLKADIDSQDQIISEQIDQSIAQNNIQKLTYIITTAYNNGKQQHKNTANINIITITIDKFDMLMKVILDNIRNPKGVILLGNLCSWSNIYKQEAFYHNLVHVVGEQMYQLKTMPQYSVMYCWALNQLLRDCNVHTFKNFLPQIKQCLNYLYLSLYHINSETIDGNATHLVHNIYRAFSHCSIYLCFPLEIILYLIQPFHANNKQKCRKPHRQVDVSNLYITISNQISSIDFPHINFEQCIKIIDYFIQSSKKVPQKILMVKSTIEDGGSQKKYKKLMSPFHSIICLVVSHCPEQIQKVADYLMLYDPINYNKQQVSKMFNMQNYDDKNKYMETDGLEERKNNYFQQLLCPYLYNRIQYYQLLLLLLQNTSRMTQVIQKLFQHPSNIIENIINDIQSYINNTQAQLCWKCMEITLILVENMRQNNMTNQLEYMLRFGLKEIIEEVIIEYPCHHISSKNYHNHIIKLGQKILDDCKYLI